MKILLLTPHLPEPARQGTALRNGAFVRHLGARHTVDLLTFLAPGELLGPDNRLHTWCRRVAAVPQPHRATVTRLRDTLLSAYPDMALRLASPEMGALVAQWTSEEAYDIVQVEGIEMARYGGYVAPGQGAQLVFDDHNCEYLLQKRNALTDLRHPGRLPAALYSLVQWGKLKRYEALACRRADAVLAVSEADAAALRALDAGIEPFVITNGIDLDEYHLADAAEGGATAAEAQATVVFTGKMDYRPNVDAVLWFAREVLPMVRAVEPGVRFQIVGRNPHERLEPLRSMPWIELTGAVEDVRPYLWGAALCVIPLRVGGGTRFKALEAMACGAPVVSTCLGVEGLGVEHGREMLLADSPQDFARAILAVLGDREMRGRLRASGRRFVEAAYGWRPIVNQLEVLYDAMLARADSGVV